MKKYQFQLEKVLKVKTIELDQLLVRLNEIRYEIKKIEDRIIELNEMEVELHKEYLTKVQTYLMGTEIKQYNFQKQMIEYQIKQLKQSLIELKLREKNQLDKVVEKKKEENMLKKLDEKLYSEYLGEANKKENQRLDEMLVLKMIQKG
jgi:flagellar FliJ protein